MRRWRSHSLLLLLLQTTGSGGTSILLGQSSASQRAVTYEEVLRLLDAGGTAILRQRLTERAIDFELTRDRETDLRRRGASDALIGLIRSKSLVAVQIGCENVECTASVSGQTLGRTGPGNSRLLKHAVPPGKVTIEVAAPGHKRDSQELIIAPGIVPTPVIFTLSLLTGRIELACEPLDCDVTLDGQPAGQTQGKRLRIADVPIGLRLVEAQAKGFKRATENVKVDADDSASVLLKLEREPPPPRLTVPDKDAKKVLDEVISALGGPRLMVADYRGVGTMTLRLGLNRPSLEEVSITGYHLNSLPSRKILWEIRIGGVPLNVVWNGEAPDSEGEVLKTTEQLQELERNIRRFAEFSLPALLAKLQKPGLRMHVERDGANIVLVAEDGTQQFELTLDQTGAAGIGLNRPTLLRYQELTGSHQTIEVTYEEYEVYDPKPDPDQVLPFVMTIRDPRDPEYSHVVRYESGKVRPDPAIAKKGFSLRRQ